MEGTDLPAVRVTTRRGDEVRGGDETLKRRVAAKFTEGDVSGAVRELASAEGLALQDGDTLRALKEKHHVLRPGHLRSLVAHVSAEAGSRLLSALTDLVNVMQRGEVPQFDVSILDRVNECAIRNKDGGIWPKMVASSLRRLSVKVASWPIVPGSKRRAEAGPVGGLS